MIQEKTRAAILLAMLSLASGLSACDGAGPSNDDDVVGPDGPILGVDCVDNTREWPDAGPGQYKIEVPTMLVPPGEEILFCYFGTYEGEDAGVVGYQPENPQGFLHHSLMKRVSDDEYPDGHLMDCTAPEFQTPPKPVLFESVGSGEEGGWINLPEGLAFKLASQQRWVADVHYINTSPEPVCVNTAYYLELVPADEVEAFAAAFNLDVGGISLPPGEVSTERFDCVWEQEVNILSIAGHMHGFGKSFEVVTHPEDGPSELVYSVDEWQPLYQSVAPTSGFEPGEFVIEEGTTLETICTWNNTSDESLSYPDEMCTTVGVAFPLDGPLFCDNGNWTQQSSPGPSGAGVVEGVVTRSVEVTNDGVGDLHVFAFDQARQSDSSGPLAMETIVNASMAGDGAAVSFRLEGLPKGIPIFLSAVFDDDDSGLQSGPTSGDLVVTPGAPSVTLESSKPVIAEVILDYAVP